MLQKLLASALLLLSFQAIALAQNAPSSPEGHYQIQGPSGPLSYEIDVTFGFIDTNGDIWFFTVATNSDSNKVASYGVLILRRNGTPDLLDAWSSDSGLWYQWEWAGDHYDKVGGSPAVRSYWRVDG